MGIKETFLADEWKNLPRLPYAVGTTIIIVSLQGIKDVQRKQKRRHWNQLNWQALVDRDWQACFQQSFSNKAKQLMQEQQNLFKQNQANYKNMTHEDL